ncbi:hypothetical protein ACJ5H2_13455 [Nocardioides sp. R1-1]|uniref:hypothetical protein n=1 Tax=Nocardioides sp. R1-1 TaxID=3383502 RepID=UPI0038D0328B
MREIAKRGQVWRSKDKRDNGRTVTVLIGATSHSGFVTVQSVRRSTMRTRTLLQRYELVKDVE